MKIALISPAGAMHRYNGMFHKGLHYAPITLALLAALVVLHTLAYQIVHIVKAVGIHLNSRSINDPALALALRLGKKVFHEFEDARLAISRSMALLFKDFEFSSAQETASSTVRLNTGFISSAKTRVPETSRAIT